MIQVINKHKVDLSKLKSPVVNVMRGSPLGNPFNITKTQSRELSIQNYRKWLWNRINSRDKAVITELAKIKQLAQQGSVFLLCCCAPKKCHANVIKSCVLWALSLERK